MWVGEVAFNVDHVMSLLEAVGYNVSLSQCRTWISPFIARGGAADKERVKCLRDSDPNLGGGVAGSPGAGGALRGH